MIMLAYWIDTVQSKSTSSNLFLWMISVALLLEALYISTYLLSFMSSLAIYPVAHYVST